MMKKDGPCNRFDGSHNHGIFATYKGTILLFPFGLLKFLAL
jgi:hypothetical protein